MVNTQFKINLVNDSKMENTVSSEFFLPLYNKCRIMIAGSGQQVLVKSLMCKCLIKPHNESEDPNSTNIFTSDKRNCDCCIIH